MRRTRYLQFARECNEMATRAHNPGEKQNFQKLADDWTKMAQAIEPDQTEDAKPQTSF
jgi:hypothetical protein